MKERDRLIKKYLGKRGTVKNSTLEGRVLKVTDDLKLAGSWGDELVEPKQFKVLHKFCIKWLTNK